MEKKDRKNCCKGCLNGDPGSNPACQAKLKMAALENKSNAKLTHDEN